MSRINLPKRAYHAVTKTQYIYLTTVRKGAERRSEPSQRGIMPGTFDRTDSKAAIALSAGAETPADRAKSRTAA